MVLPDVARREGGAKKQKMIKQANIGHTKSSNEQTKELFVCLFVCLFVDPSPVLPRSRERH